MYNINMVKMRQFLPRLKTLKVSLRGLPCPIPREEAFEFFDYNQIGAWMGEDTPCFITFESLENIDNEED